MNNKGPNKLPCGTHDMTRIHREKRLSITTFCLLFFNQSLIQFRMLLWIFKDLIFSDNLWWGTLSKAFEKSRLRTSTGVPLSISCVITSRNSSIGLKCMNCVGESHFDYYEVDCSLKVLSNSRSSFFYHNVFSHPRPVVPAV